jgi:hypothetical protein
MKFWELISVFRNEKENLKAVLDKPELEKYRFYYNNLHSLIEQQDRSLLDEEIPFELAYEVCELSKMKFYLFYENQIQTLRNSIQTERELFEEISVLDVLIRFGGSCIEETLEKNSCVIRYDV